MRYTRWLLICCVLLFNSFVILQAQESTTEPEATDVAEVTPEATTAAEVTPEATQNPEATAEPAPAGTSGGGTIYIVQRGDNLFRIALRNGLTTRQLAEANGITNPALIYVGQRLTIPGQATQPATPTPEATQVAEATPDTEATPDAEATPEATPVTATPAPDGTTTEYVVRAGDTLYRIALRNQTTVQQLVSINAIANPNLIFVGQRLQLPATGAPSAPEATEEPASVSAEFEAQFSTGVEVFLGQDVAAITDQLTQLNVEWVKITVNWSEIESEQGSPDFTILDEAVQAFDGAGFNILLTLTGSPAWARPNASEYARSLTVFNAPPDDLNTFGTFAGSVASRYAGRVDAYEIWAEPNIRRNWLNPAARLVDVVRDGQTVQEPTDAGLAPVRYIDLLESAYRAIKSADTNALVVTAGLAPTGFNDFYNAIDSFVFFEELLKQGALNFADAVSVHIDGFSNAPDASCCGTADSDPTFDESYHFFFGASLDNYRQILQRNGGTEVPLWITRFGWGTAENALASPEPQSQDYLANNTAEEQAEYTVSGLTIAEESGYVGSAFVYNLNGCAVGGTEACYYSLNDVTGSVRPVFTALQAANN